MSRLCRFPPVVLTVLLILVLPLTAVADAYRDLLTGFYPADEPGAAVLVARGDKVLFTGASGMGA